MFPATKLLRAIVLLSVSNCSCFAGKSSLFPCRGLLASFAQISVGNTTKTFMLSNQSDSSWEQLQIKIICCNWLWPAAIILFYALHSWLGCCEPRSYLKRSMVLNNTNIALSYLDSVIIGEKNVLHTTNHTWGTILSHIEYPHQSYKQDINGAAKIEASNPHMTDVILVKFSPHFDVYSVVGPSCDTVNDILDFRVDGSPSLKRYCNSNKPHTGDWLPFHFKGSFFIFQLVSKKHPDSSPRPNAYGFSFEYIGKLFNLHHLCANIYLHHILAVHPINFHVLLLYWVYLWLLTWVMLSLW